MDSATSKDDNRRSRKHNGKVTVEQVPEKSEQWIDKNCPSFSETIRNRTVYSSQQSTPTESLTPLTPENKTSKLKKKTKSKSNNFSKKLKKTRKKSKNKRKNKNHTGTTKKVKKSQLKRIRIHNVSQSQSQSQSQHQWLKKPKKTRQQTKLLLRIKKVLTNNEYKTFDNTVKLFRPIHDHDINNIHQFEDDIMKKLIKLFDQKNRQYLLPQLVSLIPAFYKTYYQKRIKRVKQINEKNYRTNNYNNNNISSLRSLTQPSNSQSLSPDWHCSHCKLCNSSQFLRCDACNAPKTENNETCDCIRKNSNSNRNDENIYDPNLANNPFKPHNKVICINGTELERISRNDSNKLGHKLDKLREILKLKYNITQLHMVFSQPVSDLLAKYAPISIDQLKYFEITPAKINKYGAEIVNVIKEYLHENGLVSPFLRENIFSKTNINCKYCMNLFDRNMISKHENECVMREICSNASQINNESNENNPIIIDDSDEDIISIHTQNERNEQEQKQVIEIDDDDDDDDDDINMDDNNTQNEFVFDEIGFLTVAELGRVRIDFNQNNNENVNVNYFHGIDDSIFTQIINNENENECFEFDDIEFSNDNEILQCLNRTEGRIRIKKQLEEKKLKLNEFTTKQNEIRQDILRIENEVCDLQQELLNFNCMT